MATNSWTPEGILGKKEYIKTGVARKSGKAYAIHSISEYVKKNKETGKPLYRRIKFFIPEKDLEFFKSLEDGQKIRLKGNPEASSYINEDGELIQQLSISLAWEDYYELLDSPGQETLLDGYSDEPF